MKRTADRLFGNDYVWSVLGAGRNQLPIAAQAVSMGGNARVGLEDSLWIGPGQLAKTNAEQVQALADAKPDAIFNVLFGADLAKFVREGNTRGLFKGVEVASLLTGEPEYLDPLKDETPNGWLVTGYPWYAIKTPEHEAFRSAYEAKFKEYPRLGSVVGYAAIKSIVEGVKKAGSTESEKLVNAFRGLNVMTPFGPVVYRPEDHQSTMGAYVGRTKNEGGKGVMVNSRYMDGAKFLPSADEVKKMRPAN